MKPIPVEASHLEVPKPIQQQPIVPPITQAGTTLMGPPPAFSKEEMLKRLASSPLFISNLNIKVPLSCPKQTSSRDTAFTKDITQQAMKDWEDTAHSSRQPQIVKRKTPEAQTVMVQEIDRDVMILPEHNLKEYYWTEEDKLENHQVLIVGA
ncbi:hypothetical protein Hanom_Chr02g00136901 [Helianthus anomalus]